MGSTYRLQLRPGDLDWAARAVAYLARLGVDTVYLSPVATAQPGSTHGYDVVDPEVLDPALGGPAAWKRLLDTADRYHIGLLIDIVPNHMAASEHNRWWADVLRNGRSSAAAEMFDIDWSAHGGRVLLAMLGRPYEEALVGGDLAVAAASGSGEPNGIEPGEPILCLGDRRLPLAPDSWPDLAPTPDALARATRGTVGQPATWDTLHRLLQRQHFRLAYWRTAGHELNYRRFFDIDGLVGVRVEDPRVFASTHGLVRRLVADPQVVGVRVDHVDGLADPAGYLAALRDTVDDYPSVTGRPVVLVEKILERHEPLPPWPVEGTTGYEFADLAVGLLIDEVGATALGAQAVSFAHLSAEGRRWAATTLFPRQLAEVASIVTAVARQRRTGFDVTGADVHRVLVELVTAMVTYRTYTTTASSAADQAAMVHAVAVARRALDDGAHTWTPAPDGRRSSSGRREEAPTDLLLRPVDTGALVRTLDEVIAVLGDPIPGPSRARQPDPGGARPGQSDPGDTHPDRPHPGHWSQWPAADQQAEARRRWQQLCTSVAAKGVEDTACYRFGGSLAQADVGASPQQPATTPDGFHRSMEQRRQHHPLALNATSSHDSKRSEDVRARLAALTEVTGGFQATMARWSRRHSPLVTATPAGPSPDRFEERFLYQTMAGIWPTRPLAPTPLHDPRRTWLLQRLEAYSRKAGREAKRRTSWTNPDEQHEEAVASFLAHLVTSAAGTGFVADMDRLVARIGPAAATNALALVVLKTMAPGVPDIYQGCEHWALTLVDPDNRNPLDLDQAGQKLDALDAVLQNSPGAPGADLLADWDSGLVKLHVTRTALHLRRQHHGLFRRGVYRALPSTGTGAHHVVSFARQLGQQWVVAVAPRLSLQLAGAGRFPCGSAVWGNTSVVLPADAPATWTDALTGARCHIRRRHLRLEEALAALPVAILVGESS